MQTSFMESDSPPTPDQLRVDILSEPLPFIQKFRGKTIVVKYDGAAMKDASLQATVGISGKSEPPASGSGSSDGSNGHPYPEFDLDPDSPVDAYYSCDYFRIFEFKVRRCARGRSHDWTDCPFAHPGEKARRRDPRKFHYSGSACPDFRKGHCKKGDSCEFAHGVFECWLHPARYRTQPCKDGTSCKRRVCFFAHTPEQLRVLPQQSPRGSNSVNSSMESYDGSPPMSPMTRLVSRSLGSSSVSEMVASLRKVKSLPTSWNVQVGSPGFVSPRWSMLRPAFCSLPSTPTRVCCEEEVPMERVESGRDLRAKMFERLRDENSQEEGTCIGFGSPVSMGGTPVLPPVNERGRNLPDIDSASLPISMGGTSVFHNVEAGRIRRMLGLLAGIRRLESLIISMGGTPVIQTGNVEGSRIRRMLAGIGIASPISMGDTLVIQTGDVEAGHLLTGSRFGVGRSDITPMNDDFRMYIGNDEPQTGNYPPPLEISGDNSHLVRPLEQHLRSNCFVILFVTSEILGMVFETIYQESHIMPYFVIWIVCVTIVMYAARRLAMIEGGMANREQFAVYLRCFSFLLLELLQYWGIHQGNYVIALKIILKVTGAVIGWWVVGVLQSYMDAFGMHLPLRRRDD